MKRHTLNCKALSALLVLLSALTNAQIAPQETNGSQQNTINTAVPFLTIAPDTRAGGMGDIGVASSPDVASQHWNVAKYAFCYEKFGISASYVPWLRKIIPDINFLYLSGYYKLKRRNALSASVRYFSLGSVVYGMSPAPLYTLTPYELAVDAGFSRKLSRHLSGGVAFRYIYSNLGGTGDVIPGTSVAADLGFYYENGIYLGSKHAEWAFGLNIKDIGTPVHYTNDDAEVRIPTTLMLGGRLTLAPLDKHSLMISIDLKKYLVPTDPILGLDSTGTEYVILYGHEESQSLAGGMFQSFYDAPGYLRPDGSRSVLLEELHEIMIGGGIEYCFDDRLFFRTGRFYEHETKGNRKFTTLGLGYRWRSITADLSYLHAARESPLQHTLRISLTLVI